MDNFIRNITAEDQDGELEGHSLTHGQTVELSQNQRDVVTAPRRGRETKKYYGRSCHKTPITICVVFISTQSTVCSLLQLMLNAGRNLQS